MLPTDTMVLDKIDIKILSALQKNGRLSNVELAEQVNLSPSPCLRRLKQLEENGIIRQYVALLDPLKIDLGFEAFVHVRLNKSDVHKNYEAFVNAIHNWPEVANCYATTGDMDYLLHVYFTNLAHFSSFIMDTLLQYQGVEDVKSSFVLKSFKRTTQLPLDHLLQD
jgi:Lrp/AsnC family leucine-responsive transcriptional regulator